MALSASLFPDHLQFLPQLNPAAVWQDAAEIYAGINHAIASDNRAGIDDRIAADLGSVADDCAEFSQAGGNVAIWRAHHDFSMIEFHVRENHARAKVCVVSEDRVADIIKMRHLRFIEQ